MRATKAAPRRRAVGSLPSFNNETVALRPVGLHHRNANGPDQWGLVQTFSAPNTNPTDTNFGKILNTQSAARSWQFALKVTY